MSMTETFLWWMLGIKSPSEEYVKFSRTYVVKPCIKGIKESKKLHKKYMAQRKKFEQKWLKQHASWKDTRQKKKALEKAFLKEFPHYKFYIKLERISKKCMI